MSTLQFQGRVILRTFFQDTGFGTYANVDRHGHFTLKQLRLPVLNETHTNSYTGPRLIIESTLVLLSSVMKQMVVKWHFIT
jgi:hypothetical protein